MQSLQAVRRQDKHKSVLKEQRHNGKVPAVVYGKNIASIPLLIEEVELTKLIREHGSNALLQLKWDKESSTVLIGDVQTHPIKGQLVHVDFQEVDLYKKTTVEVPLEWIGQEKINKGAVLQKQVHSLEVEALPANIPERIRVDVSELNIGDSLSVADLKLPDNAQAVAEEDTVLVSVLPAALETDPEEPQIDKKSEPELIDAKDGPGIDAAK